MRPILLAWTLLLGGCGHDYEDIANRRSEYARNGHGDIVVVAIDEPGSESRNYINGIRLAAEQVNARRGKLLGRKLQLQVKAGGASFESVRDTIMDIAADPRITAVLGHFLPRVAVSASVIYEASQIVFMPPFSTELDLTTHDFKFVFRMSPNNTLMADQIASVAKLLGYQNIALLYSQDAQSRELAFSFEDAAIANGMKFIYQRSFSSKDANYRELITQFSKKPVDMVFISAGPREAGRMAAQLREMGVGVPVMGSEILNERSFKETAGESADNTIAPVLYVSQTATRANRSFVAEYQKRFQTEPDEQAAQGYDSLWLLVAAIEQANSTVPLTISSTLHYMPYWAGLTGVHAFDEHGEVSGKKYLFRVLRDQEWRFLPAVHMPYFLERFDRTIQASMDRKGAAPVFAKLFSTNLHSDDLRTVQLDFLHEILQFQRLGVIYGAQKPGEEPDHVARIKALGEKRGFRVDTCRIALSTSDRKQLEDVLLHCYGKLTTEIDALNIVGLEGVDKTTLVRLQTPLEDYKIPVLALQGDTDFDEGLAIRIGRLADRQDSHTDYYVNLFDGLLHEKEVFELAELLDNLPVLSVNLKLLNEYGLLRSGRLIGLAPDLYLEWFVSSQ